MVNAVGSNLGRDVGCPYYRSKRKAAKMVEAAGIEPASASPKLQDLRA